MSLGLFFSSGCLQTGQFLHHISHILRSVNRSDDGLGGVEFREHCQEFFAP